MSKFEKSILINRPPEEVWKFMSQVENMPKWDRGVLEASQTSQNPPGVGSTIQVVRQFLGRRRVANLRVSEYVLNQSLGVQASRGQLTGQVRYTFEPVVSGTRMTSTAEVKLGGWWKLITPLLVPMLDRDGRDDLANVKRVMEAPASGSAKLA